MKLMLPLSFFATDAMKKASEIAFAVSMSRACIVIWIF